MHTFHRLFSFWGAKVFLLTLLLAAPAFATPPVISSFTVTAPNGEETASLSVKEGEQINFRWQLTGNLATQLAITPNVGDVLGRNSKIIVATAGQFTYTLTAANVDGVVSRQVTVNVLPPDPPDLPEMLYNGITLPSVWPPAPADFPTALQPPAYLVTPPATIPLNIGRQLLVDDFLIESTTLARQFHPALMHPGNPVLSPATTVENSGLGPMAMPFSNGVFYDPADSLFKIWYMCGYRQSLCYANSTDGVNWNRPSLDVVTGTNIVLTDTRLMDGYTTWIDPEEIIPARRYKLLRILFNGARNELHLHYSADGIHWEPSVAINRSLPGDRSTFFYNPFRKKWVLSLREVNNGVRLRQYSEHKDLTFALNAIVSSNPSSAEKTSANVSKWLKSDSADTPHPADPTFTPQLYDVDAAPYESLMLGQMAILRGGANKPAGRPKLNEVYFGFSRDGFNWQRPNRQAMFSVNETSGSWNWGNVQPSAGGPIVVGDQLYFYFSGRGGVPKGGYNDAGGATGLATMRRDGFASLNSGNSGNTNSSEDTLTTRPVSFNGKYLFVNAEIAAGGSLCAEVLNQNNQVIEPFSKANCLPFNGNSTKQMIEWTGMGDLAALINTPVKFRFYLKNGKLYSFWVSPTTAGISRGFVGAGGPEFGKYVDDGTVPQPSASLSPAAQTVTAGQTVTLNTRTLNAASATLTPAIANCTVNPNSIGSCSFTAITGGTTNYALTATRGNQTATATATVTINVPVIQPPAVTITPPASTATDQTAITLTGTAQASANLTQVSFSSDRGAQGLATGLANWTADIALQIGANIITVRAQDSVGNTGSAQITITRTAPSDTTPPQITLTAPTLNVFPLGTAQVSISLATDEPAICRIAPLTIAPGLFVAPNGSPANDGSFARPLDLATALSSASPARPGDTLWLRGGRYVLPGAAVSNTSEPPFRSVLNGTAGLPITVRQFPGERASIEGGIRVEGAYVNYRDFEVTNSNPNREDPRPTGMSVFGHHIKLINLVIHETGDGIGFWLPAEESEIYGALIYHNGWDNINGTRGNGHGIYAQNRNGTKRITDVISFDNYATGMKAYTEQSYANGIRFEGNISFNNGRPARVRGSGNRIANLLIGAQINPVEGSVVMNNYLYHPLTSFGESIRIGYLSTFNRDLLFKDNYIVSGGPSLGRITRWNQVMMTGNTLVGESELMKLELPAGGGTTPYVWNNNQFYSRTNPLPFTLINGAGESQTSSFAGWQQATGLDAGSQLLSGRPTGAKIFVRANQYQSGRYHIAIYNWDLLSQVTLDASALLNTGERFEVRNAQDYFGAPVLSGIYNGAPLSLLMTGTPTGPEFNAFVLSSLDRQPQGPVTIPSFSAMTAFGQTGGQTHSTLISTLNGQSYNFAIRCSDAAGNTSASQIVSFSVQGNTPPPPPPAPLDILPPTVTINGSAILNTQQSSMTLTGTAQDNIGVTQVSYSNDRGPQGAATGTNNWTATVALEVGENIVTVQATDAVGNVGSALVTVVRIDLPVSNTNRALSFDGRTGIVLPSSSNVGLLTKYWSLEAWISTTSQSASFQGILGNNEANDLLLLQGRVLVSSFSGGFTAFYGTRTVTDGNWHHLVAIRDNDRLYLYIDGQPDVDSESHQPFKLLRTTADNYFDLKAIGTRGRASDWFQGLVDDVRVYGRALSVSEVRSHYNNGTGIPVGPDAGLRMAYNFDEDSGPALDVSGNNRPATLTAGVTRVLRSGAPPPPPPADTQPPVVSILPPQATTTIQTTIPLTGTVTDNIGVTGLVYQTNRGIQGQPIGLTSWSAIVPLALGENIIIVRAQDAAGNFGSAQVTVNRTEPPPPPPPPLDTTPPQVTITAPTQTSFAAGTQQVLIAANTNENSTCRFSPNAGEAFSAMTLFASSGALTHSTNIAVADGANYALFVRCADVAGNLSVAQALSFSVQPPPPPVPPPSGGANQAMQFDGFTGNLSIPTGDNGVQTRFWTIEAWIKTNTTRIDFMTLVGNRSGNDLRMAGGQVLLSIHNGAFSHFISRRRINDNQWHHVVALRNGDRLIMYIDGQIEYAQSDNTQQGFFYVSLPNSANYFNLKSLGNRGTADEWFAGSLDDVRLYTRALSASEILAHYNNGQGIPSGPEAGLFAGFDFNEASGNVLDFSGNNRQGTLQGAAIRVNH